MEELSSSAIGGNRYRYTRDVTMAPPEVMDIHNIVLKNNAINGHVFCIFTTVLLVPAYFLSFPVQGTSAAIVSLWGLLIGFGLQLETHYQSGRTIRRFVPANKILKPVLSEYVTPVKCYWILALILHDEGELQLVFKELRPPVKILVPVWKALCAATGVNLHHMYQ